VFLGRSLWRRWILYELDVWLYVISCEHGFFWRQAIHPINMINMGGRGSTKSGSSRTSGCESLPFDDIRVPDIRNNSLHCVTSFVFPWVSISMQSSFLIPHSFCSLAARLQVASANGINACGWKKWKMEESGFKLFANRSLKA
jgi:hypothetical protein